MSCRKRSTIRASKEALRVYTTLDLNLQRAANEAVRIGMPYVDDQP